MEFWDPCVLPMCEMPGTVLQNGQVKFDYVRLESPGEPCDNS